MEKLFSVLFIVAALALFAFNVHGSIEAVAAEHYWLAAACVALSIVWLVWAFEVGGKLLQTISSRVQSWLKPKLYWALEYRAVRECFYLLAYIVAVLSAPCVWLFMIVVAVFCGPYSAFTCVRRRWQAISDDRRAIEWAYADERASKAAAGLSEAT